MTETPVSHSRLETQFSSGTAALYGSVNPQLYPEYARREVEDQFGSAADATPNPNLEARKDFWRNFAALEEYLKSGQNSQLPIVDRVYRFFTDTQEQEAQATDQTNPSGTTPDSAPKYKFGFARKQLTEKPANGLGIHLEEVQKFIGKLLLKPDGVGRFGSVGSQGSAQQEADQTPFLTDHQARLLTHVAAPMHDVLKFLGSKESQVMPDHEIVTAKLIRDFFVGQTVDLGESPIGETSELYTLTASDVEFIAGVVGDHENIHKESGRFALSHSTSAIDRAKSVFFLADTLTMAFDITEDNQVHLNEGELERRFIDLYQRHFDRSISKTFRPKWSLYSLRDFRDTFSELEKNGLSFAAENGVDSLISKIAQKMAENIENVLLRESQAKATEGKTYLSEEDIQEIKRVYDQLKQVAADGKNILSVEVEAEV